MSDTDLVAAEASLLLVDDRADNLLALSSILEPLGHAMIHARSGEEALKALLHHEVSVILLDVRMPGMDGYETASHIKSRERTRDIPIIFLTAESTESEQVLRAFTAGAVDFVTKPFEPWALQAKVQAFVDLSEKTRLLREQGDVLRTRLAEQYRKETAHLRKLAEAALAINSTQSLDEMLRVLNESAREITGAHGSETVITAVSDVALPDRSRSLSPKYEACELDLRTIDVTALYDVALEGRKPVRMTKREIAESFLSWGLANVSLSHPLMEGWLAVPLLDRSGGVLGLIQVADKIEGDFDEQDELVLVQLAQLASVAIENARRFQQEHAVAHTLQRSMLPSALPDVAGVSMAALYQAGSAGTEVGGDWYDAVVLADGRLLLVVGDVVGRGAGAAAVMGQLRTGLRAYALQQGDAAILTRSLDVLLQSLNEGMFATTVCVVVDTAAGQLDVVCAGHPPPLIVEPDGFAASYITCQPNTPLGVQPAPAYTAARFPLTPGATLLLYTDGLVEGRDTPLDAGLERLATVAASTIRGEVDVHAVCGRILAEMVGGGTGDDVALLAVRFSAT